MLSSKDVSIVYETLLSSPGMGDIVKVDLRLPRRQILLLAKVIEVGISAKGEAGTKGLLEVIDSGMLEQLVIIAGELLTKAGLKEMNDKLDSLQVK